MPGYFFRRHGIGALATSRTLENTDALIQCTLEATFKNEYPETILIQHSIYINGFADAQRFELIYTADSFLPGCKTCSVAERVLTEEDSRYISRNYRPPNDYALPFSLKRACDILCPDVVGSIAAYLSHKIAFDQLVKLAKLTHTTILFDWRWLLSSQNDLFLAFVKRSDILDVILSTKERLIQHKLAD